jgi:MtN3 and saliva related transmembrane protein
MEHIYHIDDDVLHQFQRPQGRDVVEASHVYRILALLPVEAVLQKAIPRSSTSDLSLKMLVALSAGLCLWVVYGVLKDDWVIILANSIGATLSLSVLRFKIRDLNC